MNVDNLAEQLRVVYLEGLYQGVKVDHISFEDSQEDVKELWRAVAQEAYRCLCG